MQKKRNESHLLHKNDKNVQRLITKYRFSIENNVDEVKHKILVKI